MALKIIKSTSKLKKRTACKLRTVPTSCECVDLQ